MGTKEFTVKKKKRTIVFLGAGVSRSSGVIAATKLKKKIWEELHFPDEERDEIYRQYVSDDDAGIEDFADYIEGCSLGRQVQFKEGIARMLYAPSPVLSPEYHMLAFLIKKKFIDAVYTTNQDGCLERALEAHGILYNLFAYPLEPEHGRANDAVDIYKLCGDLHSPYRMCFSTKELEECTKSKLFERFSRCFGEDCRIVFIGYSVSNDPVGNAICELSGSRVQLRKKNRDCAVLCCVDTNRSEGHNALLRERDGDEFVQMTAEEYLHSQIVQLNPRISVKHALISDKGFGGIQTYAYSLMHLQQRFGVNISISEFATRKFKDRFQSGSKKQLSFAFDLASAKAETASAIASRRPDVIHSHYFISAYMAETLGIPCVFTSHSMESIEMAAYKREAALVLQDAQEDPFSQDVGKYEDRYYRQLSNILALSDAHIEQMHADVRHGVTRVTAPFLSPEYLGVDTRISPQEMRKKLAEGKGLPQCITKAKRMDAQTFTIAFFGRPDRRKGLHIFNEIVERLAKEKVSFQAMYVGPAMVLHENRVKIVEESSSYDQRYYELFKIERDLEKNLQEYMFVSEGTNVDVQYAGFTEHLKRMYELYLASDIVVVPSSYETFGYVALEAMACRRPVVARNIGGLRSLLGEGRGFLVDDMDHDSAIAEAMTGEIRKLYGLRNDPAVIGRVAGAKAWVDAHYSEDQMKKLANQMYDIYLDAIVRGKNKPNEVVEDVLKRILGMEEDWFGLLRKSPDAYWELKQKNYPEKGAHEEVYELFWSIAYWLKVNKSVCAEVRMMSVKELAELLTDVTRFSNTGH